MEQIEVYCYAKRTFESKASAERFYVQCIKNSEGSERERYANVLADILDGFTICWDQITSLPDKIKLAYDKQY